MEGGDAGGGEGGEGGGAVEDWVGRVGEVESAEVVDGGDGDKGRGGEGGHCCWWGSGLLHDGVGGGCEVPLAFWATAPFFTHARFSTFFHGHIRACQVATVLLVQYSIMGRGTA